jgi:F0F1-type ATP synthase membrane subunit b/b'
MSMTKTEARELKPIVRRRRDQLLRELRARRAELLRDAEKYLEDEKRVILDEFQSELDKLKAELEPLIERGYDLARRLQAEGFHINEGDNVRIEGGWAYVPVGKSVLEAKVVLDTYSRRKGSKKTLRDEIEAAYSRAVAEVNKNSDEFLDNLTLQLVDSEEAKAFIANLPTVDAFLPLPNGTPLSQILAVN